MIPFLESTGGSCQDDVTLVEVFVVTENPLGGLEGTKRFQEQQRELIEIELAMLGLFNNIFLTISLWTEVIRFSIKLNANKMNETK